MDRQWLQVRTLPCEPSSFSIHTQLVGPQVVHSARIVRFRSTAIAMISCSLLFSVDVPIGILMASVSWTSAGLLPWLASLTAALLLRDVRILLCFFASTEQCTCCLMQPFLKAWSVWDPGQQDATNHALEYFSEAEVGGLGGSDCNSSHHCWWSPSSAGHGQGATPIAPTRAGERLQLGQD